MKHSLPSMSHINNLSVVVKSDSIYKEIWKVLVSSGDKNNTRPSLHLKSFLCPLT